MLVLVGSVAGREGRQAIAAGVVETLGGDIRPRSRLHQQGHFGATGLAVVTLDVT